MGRYGTNTPCHCRLSAFCPRKVIKHKGPKLIPWQCVKSRADHEAQLLTVSRLYSREKLTSRCEQFRDHFCWKMYSGRLVPEMRSISSRSALIRLGPLSTHSLCRVSFGTSKTNLFCLQIPMLCSHRAPVSNLCGFPLHMSLARAAYREHFSSPMTITKHAFEIEFFLLGFISVCIGVQSIINISCESRRPLLATSPMLPVRIPVLLSP